MDVRVTAPAGHEYHCDRLAGALSRHLSAFPDTQCERHNCLRLHLTNRCLPEPYRVYPEQGVVVSTWESSSICRYTGIAVDNYLLIASLLALSQWHVLRRNPLIRIEDLNHPANVRCVFARHHSVQEFALLLDPPIICPGCVDFYHCLGADCELIALRRVIAEAAPERGNVPRPIRVPS
jgi:hypothetical protein